MDRTSQLEQLILSGKRAHLVGIGGVSMSPLASVLAKYVPLSGSDIRESTVIEELRSKGITVHIGHSAGNVTGADFEPPARITPRSFTPAKTLYPFLRGPRRGAL